MLKSDMRLMHSLKIVHRDIKPENIMYSQSFKKNVFIDFGCSDFIQQTIGMSSRTKFVGTYEFSGP
jgi:serine/threonine protein kinase